MKFSFLQEFRRSSQRVAVDQRGPDAGRPDPQGRRGGEGPLLPQLVRPPAPALQQAERGLDQQEAQQKDRQHQDRHRDQRGLLRTIRRRKELLEVEII